MPQPRPRKLRPIALAEVLMLLTEKCVIEQHIDKLLRVVEPTNWCFGTPDAGALIVRIVRGGRGGNVQGTAERNAYGMAFRSTCLEAARLACPQLVAMCAAQWEPCDTRFWQRCDGGWIVDSTSRGGWQGSRAMQVMFVRGLEHEHDQAKLDTVAPDGLTRIGLQDDMTFIGSAAPLNRSWNEFKCTQAEAGHGL